MSIKVSTKGRYGVRAMVELGMHFGDGPIFLKDIAGRQGVSHRYLERLFSDLRKAGLIESDRGSHGGYRLARPPEEIRMDTVFEALEGPIGPVACVNDPGICPIHNTCTPHGLWAKISQSVEAVLSSTTLASLIDEEMEKRKTIGGFAQG